MKYRRSEDGDIYVDYEPGMYARVDWREMVKRWIRWVWELIKTVGER